MSKKTSEYKTYIEIAIRRLGELKEGIDSGDVLVEDLSISERIREAGDLDSTHSLIIDMDYKIKF